MRDGPGVGRILQWDGCRPARPANAPGANQHLAPAGGRSVNIGEASRATGVPSKLIRYYEQIGLIRPAGRTDGNYRTFADADIRDLSFIRRARALGFSVAEIEELLSLWRNEPRPQGAVKRIADAYVCDLESRIAELESMADTLRRLSSTCESQDQPEAPDASGRAEAATSA